jgi:hypothetical protein
MREDPIFSGGWLKAALVVLVAAALGVGAYVLASGVDVNLPKLPDLNKTDTATNLSNTTLGNTTIGRTQTQPQPEAPATSNPFTSAAFGSALDKVRAAVGPNQQLTRVTIDDAKTQFSVRRGSGIEAYSVKADSGDLIRQNATITISGNATIADFSFGLDGLQPSAVDRMLDSARKQGGAGDFNPTLLDLERRIPAGSRELGWTINAEGGGRNLTYQAAANGGQVQDIGGSR